MDNKNLSNRPRVLPNGHPMDPKRAEEMLAEWDKLRQAEKNKNIFASLLRKLHLIK